MFIKFIKFMAEINFECAISRSAPDALVEPTNENAPQAG